MVPSDLDIISNPFCDSAIINYELELPPSGNKIGFNLLYNYDFTTPYIINTIPNSPSGYQLPTQTKKNVCIIDINGEEPIIENISLDVIQHYQTQV